MVTFDFISEIPKSQAILIPFFAEDAKKLSRKTLQGLSLVQKRRIKRALQSDHLPKTGTLPIFSRDAVAILLFLEKKRKFGTREAREAGENAFQLMKRYNISELTVVAGALQKDLLKVFREGLLLGSYDFTKWKGKKKEEKDAEEVAKKEQKLEKLYFIGARDSQEKKRLEIMAEGVEFARDLINTPPDVATPSLMVKKAQEFARALPAVTVKIMGEKELKHLGCNGILAVGRGSTEESRLIILEYKGGKKEAPLALVGKGVTYDTGGLSLKPGRYMHTMKQDLGGAATVLGALWTIAKSKLPKNVIAVIPTVENLISAAAYKPDEVIKMYNGVTVEVTNTDAEGRLILADALAYIEEIAKPRAIVDLATLTGAVSYAIGNDFTALLTPNQKLSAALLAAAQKTDEPLWELPLHERYKSFLESPIADIVNSADALKPGTIEAGLFLQYFVTEKTPWAHLDIASVAFDDKKGIATGRNVRLLWDFVENF